MVRTLGLINNRLTELADNNAALVNAIRGSGDLNAREPAPYDTSFSSITIDLSSANVDRKITVPRPCAYVQAWCDGVLDGIGIKIKTQDRPITYFSQFNIIPVPNPDIIYLSNDVRVGRSKVILIFSRSVPLSPQLWGEGIDLKELAVRLGAISSYDRRGEIIFQDDFENGLVKWETETSGIGAAVALSALRAYRGAFSVKCTGGSDANKYAGIKRYITPPIMVTPLGFEITISIDANIDEGQGLFDFYMGTIVAHYGFKYSQTNSKAYVLTAAGVWTEVADSLVIYPDLDNFTTLKCVINPLYTELNYYRLSFGYVNIDVSAYKGYTAADVSAPRMILTGRLVSNAAVNGVGHVDSAIATQNEPI